MCVGVDSGTLAGDWSAPSEHALLVLPQRSLVRRRQAAAALPRRHARWITAGIVGSESVVTPLNVRQIARQRVDGQVGIDHRIVRQQRVGKPLQMDDAVIILGAVLDQFRVGVQRNIEGGSVGPFIVGQRLGPRFRRRARGTDILSPVP